MGSGPLFLFLSPELPATSASTSRRPLPVKGLGGGVALSCVGGDGTDERQHVGVAEELERARALAGRVVASHGLEVFDVQFRREAIGWVLRVVIDRPPRFGPGGEVLVDDIDASIGIAECQQVSEDLGTVLDVEDPLSREYTLEVSSPGLDRPLRDATDYRRFAGRLVKLVAKEPVDGQSHFEGRLAGLDGNEVLIEVGRGKQRRVPLAQVGRARLEVEF